MSTNENENEVQNEVQRPTPETQVPEPTAEAPAPEEQQEVPAETQDSSSQPEAGQASEDDENPYLRTINKLREQLKAARAEVEQYKGVKVPQAEYDRVVAELKRVNAERRKLAQELAEKSE